MSYYNINYHTYLNNEKDAIASFILLLNIVSVFSIVLIFILSIPYFHVSIYIIMNLIYTVFILMLLSLILCFYYKIKFT